MLSILQPETAIQPDLSVRSSKTINNNASLSSEVIDTLVSLSKYASLIELPNGIVVYFLKRSVLSKLRKEKQKNIQGNQPTVLPEIHNTQRHNNGLHQNMSAVQQQQLHQLKKSEAIQEGIEQNAQEDKLGNKIQQNPRFSFFKNIMTKQLSPERAKPKEKQRYTHQGNLNQQLIGESQTTPDYDINQSTFNDTIQQNKGQEDKIQPQGIPVSSYQLIQSKLGHKVDVSDIKQGIVSENQIFDYENESLDNIRQKIMQKKQQKLQNIQQTSNSEQKQIVQGQYAQQQQQILQDKQLDVLNIYQNQQSSYQSKRKNSNSKIVLQESEDTHSDKSIQKDALNNQQLQKLAQLQNEPLQVSPDGDFKLQREINNIQNNINRNHRYQDLEAYSPGSQNKFSEDIPNLDDNTIYLDSETTLQASETSFAQNVSRPVTKQAYSRSSLLKKPKLKQIQQLKSNVSDILEKSPNVSPAFIRLKEQMRKYKNRNIAKISEEGQIESYTSSDKISPHQKQTVKKKELLVKSEAKQALNEVMISLAKGNQDSIKQYGNRAQTSNARTRQQQQILENYQQHLKSNQFKAPKQNSRLQQKKNQDSDSEDEGNNKKQGYKFDDIMDQSDQQQDLIQCMECKRSFNPHAYQVHEKVCAKVFQGKRKKFDSALKRMEGVVPNPKSVGRQTQQSSKLNQSPSRKIRPGQPLDLTATLKKQPKWKMQSEQLRSAMKANRGDLGEDQYTQLQGGSRAAPQVQQYDDRVECPYCKRRYNADVADRHIPKCRDIVAKPSILKSNAGKGAYARNISKR